MLIADLLDSNNLSPFTHPSGGYDWVGRIKANGDQYEIIGDQEKMLRALGIKILVSDEGEARSLSFVDDPERWLRNSDAGFRTGYIFFSIYADTELEAHLKERARLVGQIDRQIIDLGVNEPDPQQAEAKHESEQAYLKRNASRVQEMLKAHDAPSLEERLLLPWKEPVLESSSLATKARSYWKVPTPSR